MAGIYNAGLITLAHRASQIFIRNNQVCLFFVLLISVHIRFFRHRFFSSLIGFFENLFSLLLCLKKMFLFQQCLNLGELKGENSISDSILYGGGAERVLCKIIDRFSKEFDSYYFVIRKGWASWRKRWCKKIHLSSVDGKYSSPTF